jgi:prepilin-type N-terminal cleavage/methylation domain-containing protein
VTYSSRLQAQSGFSLIEVLISMGIFLTICGAAFTLFNKEQTTYLRQQGQVGINISLRNATAQLQMDLSNAGTAYFQGANIPAWPVGVTIVNNVVASGTTCYNAVSFTYTSKCFDALNIIAGADPSAYPPINSTDVTGGGGSGNCTDTSTGTAYGQAAPGLTLIQTAAGYLTGDSILFLTSNGKKMTSVVLTGNPVVAGSAVVFAFNGTRLDGTNTLAHDPLDITACDNLTCPTPNNFGNQFCGGDWILKLAPITYQVDSSNSTNPKLTRTSNGVTSIVMEQVIGFKVGATTWNNATDTVSTQYNYDASTYSNNVAGDQAWNFTLVRSLRMSLIGRTTPNVNPQYLFRNPFDNGPYQVEGMSIVVNPRNLSMND